ncbi:transposase [Chitinophagaceae bacterium MMS25-I14]
MKTFLYSEEQRRWWVQQKVSRAKTVKQICREAAISRATLYNWIAEFPDLAIDENEMQPSTAEAPHEVLKRVREQSGEPDPVAKYRMLLNALGTVDTDKSVARKLVGVLVKRYTLTVAQACAMVGIEEAVYGYKPRKPEGDDEEVYDELVRLITEEPSRGFTECYEILQRTNPGWPRKQIRRVYKERRVFLLRKRTRRLPAGANRNENTAEEIQEQPVVRQQRPGATWSLGLIEDKLSDAPFWLLYIMDAEDGAILNATSGGGYVNIEDILDFLSLATMENGQPRKLRIAGREPFTGREITRWTWDQKVTLITLSLGKPENQEMLQSMDDRVSRAVQQSHAGNITELQDWIEESLVAKG